MRADVAVDVAEHERIGRQARELAQAEPLEREVRRERLGARVGEHALDLLLQHGGIGEPIGRGELEQLGIGDRAP